jgi:DNA replication and repair protein RadC
MTELAPREKLTLLGAEALSDAELLAIFLRHRHARQQRDGAGAADAE